MLKKIFVIAGSFIAGLACNLALLFNHLSIDMTSILFSAFFSFAIAIAIYGKNAIQDTGEFGIKLMENILAAGLIVPYGFFIYLMLPKLLGKISLAGNPAFSQTGLYATVFLAIAVLAVIVESTKRKILNLLVY
ncbi:hypothetical protein DESAMIL20_299 [Desulfurella amilsii]|jgi:hypothetical protein|uniref:Uncharacterized protein n=1 Tax=Desulfurella amilsii TaxID=1562698 RepID=A0A1X4XZ96_9BACT|nr:hypothetical protein [Desulfurella amilsii]OSS42869.1 hypothetical protein DESAMIL20_299 [Desulfurella amilsii]